MSSTTETTITLKEGAILVSDVHLDQERNTFYYFLQALYDGVIKTPQLILLGDVFDLLFAPIQSLLKRHEKVITLINALSTKIEIVYFEGNHDFLLTPLFQNVRVIPLQKQPLLCHNNIYLAHGDYALNWQYRVYTAIIRNFYVMKFLNFINNISNNSIVIKLDKYLAKKDHCHKFTNFEAWITKRIGQLHLIDNKDITFIEGHHHQGKSLKINTIYYNNLEAFACNQSFYSVQYKNNFVKLVQHKFKSDEL